MLKAITKMVGEVREVVANAPMAVQRLRRQAAAQRMKLRFPLCLTLLYHT